MFLILMKICLQCLRKRLVKFFIIPARLLKQCLDVYTSNLGTRENQKVKANLAYLISDIGSSEKGFRHLKYTII